MFGRPKGADAADMRWIDAAYRGLLERQPEAAGLAHWRAFFARGGTPEQMLRGFVHGEEFLARVRTAQHAVALPELVHAVYRGLLEREPEVQGLEFWLDHLLRGGSLAAMLREFAGSDEFLAKAGQRAELGHAGSVDSRYAAGPRLLVVSNCQGDSLARCIQALTGAQPPAFRLLDPADLRKPQASAALRRLFEEHDRVLIQPAQAQAVRETCPGLAPKMLCWPAVSYAAFHPDQCYVHVARGCGEVRGPAGPYHSSLAYYAWQRGLTAAQALRLFRAEVYEELGFFDYRAAAAQALLEEGGRAGMPMEELLHGWSLRGCFMHSAGHPKLHVLLDLARSLLQRLGLPVLPVDPLEFLHDGLADHAVWPVYPEIGERLGVGGAYVFKGNNPGLSSRAPMLLYGLEEFVERSYQAYARHGQGETLICDRDFGERYARAVARQFAGARPPRPAAVPAHPYAALPARNFWNKAVAGVAPAQLDPVGAAPFTIDRSTRVASAGSCFAQHISQRLVQAGFNYLVTEAAPPDFAGDAAAASSYGLYSARYGNVYTTRQLLQLLERAYGRFAPQEPAWRRPDGRWADPFRPQVEPGGYADRAALEADRAAHLAAVRALFERLEVLVFTLGLTECWRSRADGAVFPLAPGVAAGSMDAARHEFVNFGAADIAADLLAFIAGLRAVNPAARLILTVSPVPLAATYEPQHVLVASSGSKSALRAAVAEVVRGVPQVAYFPSYEIVGGSYSRGAYFAPDLRGVTAAGVDQVMRLFFRHYAPLEAAVGAPPDAALLAEARRAVRLVCEEELLAPPLPRS